MTGPFTRAYTATSLFALERSHDALRANLRRMLNLLAQISGEEVLTYRTYHDAKNALLAADAIVSRADGGTP